MLQKIAEFNHKYAFRYIVSILARITDRIPVAVADLFLWIYLAGAIVTPFLLLASVYFSWLAFQEATTSAAQVVGLSLFILGVHYFIFFSYVMIMFGWHYFRKPYWEKMGFEPVDFDFDEESEYVIHQLENLPEPPRPGPHLWQKMHFAVRNYTLVWDGYDFYSVKRIKRSYFSSTIRKTNMVGGLYNPLLPEVVIFDPTLTMEIAHEYVHTRGHVKEAETDFNALVSLISSNDPELKYWGYYGWLARLLSFRKQTDKLWNAVNYLKTQQAPEYVIQKYKEEAHEGEVLQKELDEKIHHMEETTGILGKAVAVIMFLVFAIPIAVSYLVRQIILKGTGQKDIATSYTELPLRYMAGYRRRFL